ncbi:hypothetical protein ISN45_Aa03g037360 [Arabidopsis thaliana x Arabidopsis arenosa]|uniref:Uncharacterized protein n=1 Tax=Arabidopsis thaliana x Arabidopsis arenosa TaxID=1240361 RepID=A0A8T2B6L9_9BRAS|nr:hypothetical protein ISN45_Aa03g037360 [Arabidopsis thaliana x Arabidopsis arenosa]
MTLKSKSFEKLSVKAPDGPTKIKILTEIATQHNVTWEAESLVESDPKETVLTSGASSCHSQSATLGFVLLAMVALKPLINVLYRCYDVKHIYKKEEWVLNILCKVEKTHLDSQFYESDN